MTVTPAKWEANRRNAQKSTGPRTREGKRRSRMNAFKHGRYCTVIDPKWVAHVLRTLGLDKTKPKAAKIANGRSGVAASG